MPAAVAVPIIGAAIGGGANIAGAAMASSANKDATQTTKELSEKALEYQKEQDAYRRRTEANRYGAVMAGLSPYASEGSHANAALGSFLGIGAPASESTPGPMTSNLVTMQAPDGSTKQVPASEMQHWIDRGATLTGATSAQGGGMAAGPVSASYSPADVLARTSNVHFRPALGL